MAALNQQLEEAKKLKEQAEKARLQAEEDKAKAEREREMRLSSTPTMSA